MDESSIITTLTQGPPEPESKRNLALISIDEVVQGQRELMRAFVKKISHVQPFLQKAMVKAYSDALDEMALLLDKSRAG